MEKTGQHRAGRRYKYLDLRKQLERGGGYEKVHVAVIQHLVIDLLPLYSHSKRKMGFTNSCVSDEICRRRSAEHGAGKSAIAIVLVIKARVM